MAVGLLHQVFRVADDVLVLRPGSKPAAGSVHHAADPDRLGVLERHQHHLRCVERPAIVGGQIVLIADVGHDQQIEPVSLHFTADRQKPRLILFN